jgi:flagellar motility protein MotE (MotC chaperone)
LDVVGIGSALPVAGPAAILLVIIAILTRLWLKASGVGAAEITRVRAAYSAEIDRINKAHNDELAELKHDIAELREGMDKLNARVDEERELRRRAEDTAAEALRRSGGTDAR